MDTTTTPPNPGPGPLMQESDVQDEIVFTQGTQIGDGFLAALMIVCMLAGLPGNMLSSVFFGRRVLRKTVHDALYFVASTADTCILVCAFAPISVLVAKERAPAVFSNDAVCTSWAFFFFVMTRYTLFIAMVISVVRTLSIFMPFYIINKNAVLGSCALYGFWLIAKDSVFYDRGYIQAQFSHHLCSCTRILEGTGGRVFVIISGLEILAVMVIVLVSFAISFFSLTKTSRIKSRNADKVTDATTTIALFTFASVMCNIPLFAMAVVDTAGKFSSFSMNTKAYVKLLSYVVFIVLNSAVNPCIYVTRMPVYKKWALGQVSVIGRSTVSQNQSSDKTS